MELVGARNAFPCNGKCSFQIFPLLRRKRTHLMNSRHDASDPFRTCEHPGEDAEIRAGHLGYKPPAPAVLFPERPAAQPLPAPPGAQLLVQKPIMN